LIGHESRDDGRAVLAAKPADGIAVATMLGCLSILFLSFLHPRIGIRDWDGWSYLIGAMSLHKGNGYRDPEGNPLNRWPIGYSFVLSLFSDPVRGAQVVNYLSYGVAIAFLYLLLRRRGWTWQSALGLTVTLGAGFFRLLATMVHADILTYAVFFAALFFVTHGGGRSLPGSAWAGLFAFKFIAILFLPPAIVADWLTLRLRPGALVRRYLPAVLATAAAVVFILVFDFLTERSLIPAGHESLTLENLARAGRSFVLNSFRAFIFDWYGSVRTPFGTGAFAICLILIALCLASLRAKAQGRWLRVYGVTWLVCAALLLLVRWYETSPRLVGYGMIALILGFNPTKRANWLWMMLGTASLLTGLVNGMTVNSSGGNDGRYAAVAKQLRDYYRGEDVIATNSTVFIYADAKVAEVDDPVLAQTQDFRKFLWVTLPQYDGVQEMVAASPRPGRGWCEERRFTGAVLFARCAEAF
jgi:hypothetical protein